MNANTKYNHSLVETKWQDKWLREKTFSPDVNKAKKPYYNLMMFPYPSAEGLHVGNMYAFTGADVYGRFKRMQGYDVMEPIGLDGFGIHSENYAIKVGRHPKEHAEISQKNFYKQLHMIGNSFDWTRTLETYDPNYYKWTQWLFIKMFKAGLAYKSNAKVNWCPTDKTVLSDEQVIDGKCERCGSEVTTREMSSWFFRITKYADRLLNNIDKIDWPNKIKVAQKNWIGRKDGINITYDVVGQSEKIEVFTTAPVNFGMTFLVLSPEHSLLKKLKLPKENQKDVDKYIKEYLSSTSGNKNEAKIKTGVFTGLYVVNPINNKEVPVWVSNFVVAGVGTGAVQGCPGHDLNDFEFAKKYNLPVVRVIVGKDGDTSEITQKEQIIEHGEEGKFINSEFLDGLDFEAGLQKTMDWFERKGVGKRVTSYHLRDWGISRQRYWGPPIPMIFCQSCSTNKKSWEIPNPKHQIPNNMFGWFPVPETDLPVVLPDITDFKPQGDGTSPLHNAPDSWKQVKCPNCGKMAERELDVSDTFLDSSWYFLRYPSVNENSKQEAPNYERSSSVKQIQNSKIGNSKTFGFRNSDFELPFDSEITKRWLPVDTYIGGAEHAVLHLMYARFVTMVLNDLGYLTFEEPFPFLFGHGLIIKDGAKMSKSKGNVVNPDEYINKFGADTLRTYLMFLGPYDQGGDFRDSGIEGMAKFIQRVWNTVQNPKQLAKENENEVYAKLHQTIKKVTQDVSNFKYNTAISSLMELVNTIIQKGADETIIKNLCLMMAPFAPHITEELWETVIQKSKFKSQKLNSIHKEAWPEYDSKYLKTDQATIIVQVNGKMRAQLRLNNQIANNKSQIETIAKQDGKASVWLKDKTIKNVIFVPGKVINFVV